MLNIFVIAATKGRPNEVAKLLDCITNQTVKVTHTVISGTTLSDIELANSHELIKSGNGTAFVSERIGSSAQRNYALEYLEQQGYLDPSKGRYMVAFFDDDFRMANDWLEKAQERLLKGDIAGLTGHVFADGAKTGFTGVVYAEGLRSGELNEEIANEYLKGKRPPQPHWASGDKERTIASVYGCNMAFPDFVIQTTRFDENVPLYGWQEDRDFCGMAKKLGKIIYYPPCKGVHLGTKSGGRANGLRFGYSQIINSIYFMNKGTLTIPQALISIARGIASNLLHSMIENTYTDYRGRLHGNVLALSDAINGEINPKKILSL